MTSQFQVWDRRIMEPLSPQREPVEGDLVYEYAGKIRIIHHEWSPPVETITPTLTEVTNWKVSSDLISENNGIFKVKMGSEFTITANCEIPDDADMTLIIERILKGNTSNVVGDIRVHTTVVGGVITATGSFDIKGNYVLTAERTNLGLENLGKDLLLEFPKLEFNVI